MRIGQILVKPVISERSLAQAKEGKYTFKVAQNADKSEITRSVEKTFDVHVTGISTLNMKGKKRRFGARRKTVVTSGYKKAVVTLKKDEKIDLFSVSSEKEEEKEKGEKNA